MSTEDQPLLQLQYSLTADDQREAQELNVRQEFGGGSKWKTSVVLLLIMACVACGFVYQVRREVSPPYRPYVYAGFVALYLFLLWKQKKAVTKPESVIAQASDTELTLIAGDSRSSWRWSTFAQCVESTNLFVLIDKPKMLLIPIPKRAFPNEEWQAWFRDTARYGQAQPPVTPALTLPEPQATNGIVVKYKLGFRDYIDRTLASGPCWLFTVLFMGLLLGTLVYQSTKPHPHAVNSNTKVFLILLPFMLFMPVMFALLHSFTAWRSHMGYLVPQQTALSDKGLFEHNQDTTSVVPWETYKNYKETRRSFIIWNTHRGWLLLPKRAFSTKEDIDRCRKLLADHLTPSRWFWG